MKPNYKNWLPKGMILETAAGFVLCLTLALLFGLTDLIHNDGWRTALTIVTAVLAAVCLLGTAWEIVMYRAFSYDGKRQMSREIINGVAEYVTIPEGGKGLDVGCGSGALAIAAAKRNPKAEVTGIDRWGVDYASFSQKLCEDNAVAEGTPNTRFGKGNAVKLEFPDESFDAVMSNYVYHNIPSMDRKEILLETLRVLKKGGTFALHDIFSRQKYGDMEAFVRRLKEMGYERVELIDTTDGKFMTPREARLTGLTGSALLTGKK